MFGNATENAFTMLDNNCEAAEKALSKCVHMVSHRMRLSPNFPLGPAPSAHGALSLKEIVSEVQWK